MHVNQYKHWNNHTHTHTHTHTVTVLTHVYQLNNQWNQFITYHFYQATKLTCAGSSKDSYTSPEQPWSFPASLSMANCCSFQVSLSAHFLSLQYNYRCHCQMVKWYWHYMSSSKFCCQTISCRNRPCWSSPIIRLQRKRLHTYYTLGKLTLHSRKSIPAEKTHMLIPPLLQSHQHHHQWRTTIMKYND